MKKIVLFIFIISSFQSFGQAKIWSDFGDQALKEGDNYGASRFYLKAWVDDSTFNGLVYKLGIAFKGYHNNNKALYYLKKIENNKALQIKHPDYLFHLGELYKGIGEYKLSRDYFEKFSRLKIGFDSYRQLKARNELKVHGDIVRLIVDTANVDVINLGDDINTGVAEYYPVWLNDSIILYSSLKAYNVNKDGVIKDESYVVQLYTGHKHDSTWFSGSAIISESLRGISFSDGSFDENGDFYFVRQFENANYQLAKTKLILKESITEKNKTKYSLRMDSVKSVFKGQNNDEFNYRNPFVFNLEGKKYLLFSSNILGGRGKMDLWYSENKDGSWNEPKNLGAKINSPGDEVGPNYDVNTNRFYFSSNWHYGLGGFDLFEAEGFWKRPTSIVNMGIPFNSSLNDLYIAPLDSLSGLFTSSRIGSKTSKDAVCCNDLYEYRKVVPKVDSALREITEVLSRDSIMKRLQRLVEEFHVTLYFHNDRPNPDSWDTITPYSYLGTYDAYLDSIPTYYIRNTFGKSGEDSIAAYNRINDFFDEYVHKGVEDLRVFSEELLKELEMGNKILLTVKGYASPLAKSDYNVNLTLRRVNSLQNYLRDYPGDVFSNYLDETAENGGVLRIKKVSFGEFKSDSMVSDNYYDTKKSVYSKEASLERRVEVINLTLLEEDSVDQPNLLIDLDSSTTIFNLGVLDTTVFNWSFELENKTDKMIKVVDVEAGCGCLRPQNKMLEIYPKESEILEVQVDLSKYSGKLGRRIDLILSDGSKKSIILFMELPKK